MGEKSVGVKILEGKRVAILVESEYIPEEIRAYKSHFAKLGASVDIMSKLWGNDSISFVSDVDEPGKELETMEVNIDFDDVDLNDYAAVIMSACYTSVRLRYFIPPDGEAIDPEQTKTASAVQFFVKAMKNPNIVKGALCHGLWLLTPVPSLLRGRRIICHEVVLSDIANAGGVYVPDKSGVVVDGDLVTGRSKNEVIPFIDAIAAQVCKPKSKRKKGPKKVLTVVSEWGYWGEELVGPIEELDSAGYEPVIFTPKGKRPHVLPPSADSTYIDPPLGRTVVSPEMEAKVKAFEASTRLDNPLSIEDIAPQSPYYSSENYLRELEDYYHKLEDMESKLCEYAAILLVGGSGAIVDMANNQRLNDVILAFYRMDKPIAAECYGVSCLAFARDVRNRRSIIWGKRITGHPVEYDYKDGTGFVGVDFNMGPPPYPLEYILRDATGPKGEYISNVGNRTSVIVDYPFISSRSTASSVLCGKKLVECLDKGLRRFGW